MSKKTLLNETQVRKFMKLASLEPLTARFISEEMAESHGRGRGEGDAGYGRPDNNTRLEEEADAESLEDYAAGDLERGHPEEAEDDELEADAELDDAGDDGGDRTVSVDDFLSALESALEGVMGDEVEIDADQMDDEVEADVEMDAADDEVDLDLEDDDMLEEDKAYTAKKEKPGADKRKGAEKRGAEGTLAKTKGHGRVDYVNEEEGSKKGEYRRKDKDGKVGKRAGEGKDGHYKDYEGPAGGNKGDKSKTDPGHKDYMKESAATDELVEQITKRVAARILKSALKKKSNVNEGVMGDLGRMAKKGLARATGTSREEFLDDHFSKKIAPHLERVLSTHASKPHDLGKLKSQWLGSKAKMGDSDTAWQAGTIDPKQEAYQIAHTHMQDAGDRAGLKSMYDNEGDRIEN